MTKVLVSEKYLHDIANAIRVKLDSQSTYTPAQMAAAIADITGSISGTITPSTDADKVLVTDSNLTAIANAIRAKLDVETLYTPAQMADAILSIQASGPTIVTWASGTDEQIAAMVAALDAGTLTIADTGWSIGDERVVPLSAMAATGVSESHVAQNATFVLMDSQHYDLVGGGKDHFVVGLKGCLNEEGYMNSSATNSGSWDGCARRTWCNNVFRQAIPETLRNCFKQFVCKTAETYDGRNVKSSNDYFALFAEKEVNGSRFASNQYEADALTQVAYYSQSANRTKKRNGNNAGYFLRSPQESTPNKFLYISSSAAVNWSDADVVWGIAPFGCI